MALRDNLPVLRRRRRQTTEIERSSAPLDWDEYVSYFSYSGSMFPFQQFLQQTMPGSKEEEITSDFQGFANLAFKRNGPIFACIMVRMLLFSDVRFQFRNRSWSNTPGRLFGTTELSILEQPWPNGTTRDLLSRAELDISLGGNFFVTRYIGADRKQRLRRLRPDWVTIVLGSLQDPEAAAWDIDAEVLGYLYRPGGKLGTKNAIPLNVEDVAHYVAMPDPEAEFRGMSWLTPVINETMADKAATRHKLKFFENGATPNLVITLDVKDQDAYDRWVGKFREKNEGWQNAYRTLILAAGADPKVVGANFREIDFKATQGAGETRIASAAGVPPIIAGFSEGLASATYSNYGQARRRLADGTMRPLWGNIAGSLAKLVNVPSDAELWYDDSDVSFVKEDKADAADILFTQGQTIKTLTDAGFEPGATVGAVTAGDLSPLAVNHSGLFSVQLQPPNSGEPSANGNGASQNGNFTVVPARTEAEIQAIVREEIRRHQREERRVARRGG